MLNYSSKENEQLLFEGLKIYFQFQTAMASCRERIFNDEWPHELGVTPNELNIQMARLLGNEDEVRDFYFYCDNTLLKGMYYPSQTKIREKLKEIRSMEI